MMTNNSTTDLRPIEDLVTRVNALVTMPTGRVIGFIASGSQEGTTTVARAYASLLVSHMRKRVLFLSVGGTCNAGPGILATMASGAELGSCLHTAENGCLVGSLTGGDTACTQWELLGRADLWQTLRAQFDDIVLDLPTPEVSRIGLATAMVCDGVVVVLEADKTRAPVIENLVSSLRAVKVPILGTVFNKRRFYLPKWLYQRL
jgi:hypothetical protein